MLFGPYSGSHRKLPALSGTGTWQEMAADPHHGAVSLHPAGPLALGSVVGRCCVELSQAPAEQHSAGPGGSGVRPHRPQQTHVPPSAATLGALLGPEKTEHVATGPKQPCDYQ